MAKKNLIQGSLSLKELLHRVREELIESEKETLKSGHPALFVTNELVLEVNFVLICPAVVDTAERYVPSSR